MTRSEVQALLAANREAWTPRDGEAWPDFVRRKAPPRPSWFRPIDRRDYERAMRIALERGETKEADPAFILPFWIANNEDEEPRDDEWRRRLVVWSERGAIVDIACPDALSIWMRAEVLCSRGSFVTLGRHYAPGIAIDRFGVFAVVSALAGVTIASVAGSDRASPVTKPTRAVPAFSCNLEVAIDLATAPHEVRDAAARIAEDLAFGPDESDDRGESVGGDEG